MECRAGDGGADEDPHFDKLRFGEPHGCYETHSVFKGRLKRSLDHSFETVPGTVRHWRQAHTQTRREIRSGETRLRRTSGTFRRDSPLFRDLKFPMNLTYSYTGGSLGSMVPLSMWQQNSSWFFAGVKKKRKDEKPDLQDDGKDATPAAEGELYFSDIRASASLLPWCGRTEPCTRLSAPRLARSSAGSGPRDQTERRKAAADKL